MEFKLEKKIAAEFSLWPILWTGALRMLKASETDTHYLRTFGAGSVPVGIHSKTRQETSSPQCGGVEQGLFKLCARWAMPCKEVVTREWQEL